METESYSQSIKNHDVYERESDVNGTWDECKEALPSPDHVSGE